MRAQGHPASDIARVTEGTARITETVGRFTVDVSTERWWWSDGMYYLHGFEPGQVIPTTELMLAHREAAEGPQEERSLTAIVDASDTGEPFGSTYRIVDAQGRERTVAVVASVRATDLDRPRQVEGYMLDLTPGEQARLETEIRTAVTSFRTRAATIEQAKGILMELFALPADAAFEVLRDHSNQANVKLHSLAERLVRYGPARSDTVTRPRVGDPVLARRLGLLTGEVIEDLAIDLRWSSPRNAEITLTGRIVESDVARIDECVSALLATSPCVLTVRLDLRRSRGPAAAMPALRRALVRLHHAGIAVEVVGDDDATERTARVPTG